MFKKGHSINNGRPAWNKGIPATDKHKEQQRKKMKGKFSGEKHPMYSHGMTKTPIYRIWCGIKRRCLNKNERSYKHYGGRGIKICDRWMNFENFFEDIGNSYEKGLSIERIDVNGDYCSENCKWIPIKEQAKNKRNVEIYTYNGVRKNLPDWCKEFGLEYSMVRVRIRILGWSFEKALLTPKNK